MFTTDSPEMDMSARVYDCVIIGSGPAGYTAAIYASRANLKPLLLQGIQPGGQLMTTTDVENFPAFPEGIVGPELMDKMQQQAQVLGTDVRLATVTRVDFSVRPFLLELDESEQIFARGVIIATGASAKWLGLESEQRLNGKGVSACAICDGFFFKGKVVGVVGGGDTACEEAVYLSNICTHVHMIVRSAQMRASKAMQAKVARRTNITVHYNYQTQDIVGTERVEGVRIQNILTQQDEQIELQGLFIAIGHQPNTAVFAPFIQTDDQGYIVTHPGTTRTNVEGVFAAGDVQDKHYRQAITAAGYGCMAALSLERYLADLQ